MKERPILFSGPMVRAIREGRKTQTRRAIKFEWCGSREALMHQATFDPAYKCPYGQPGDRLWVRETFRLFDSSVECSCYDDCKCASFNGKPVYRADFFSIEEKWQPSIHMPRWASRITLEIISVRVERLNNITEEDAKAEGVDFGFWHPQQGVFSEPTDEEDEQNSCFRDGFGFLWESIHGPGSWDANPWVWVIEFKEVKP